VTFDRTQREVTEKERLQPRDASYWRERLALFWLSEMPFAVTMRERVGEPRLLREGRVVWRNYEASYDLADGAPVSRRPWRYLLQESFVPIARFDDFAPRLAEILSRREVNVINVSIRHADRDRGSLLAWAREECFAFVIFYKQNVDQPARDEVRD